MAPRKGILTAALFTLAGGLPLAGIVLVTVRDWHRLTSTPVHVWAGGAALAGVVVAVFMLWMWGIRKLVTVIDRTYQTQAQPPAAQRNPVPRPLSAPEPFGAQVWECMNCGARIEPGPIPTEGWRWAYGGWEHTCGVSSRSRVPNGYFRASLLDPRTR
jgi:hypothetical protein